MFRFLIRIGGLVGRFLRSSNGRFVAKAVKLAVPIIRDIRRKNSGRDRRDVVNDAKLAFEVLLNDPDFPEQFLKQRQAYESIMAMLIANPKFDNDKATASNVLKILELTHGAIKEGA